MTASEKHACSGAKPLVEVAVVIPALNEEACIADVVRRIQNAGIYVLGNFIFGLPEDNRERMQQTLDMALELNCEFANLYSAMAYPGSPLYRLAIDGGIELPEKWHHFSQHGYETKPLSTKARASDAEPNRRASAAPLPKADGLPGKTKRPAGFRTT